MEPRIPDEQIFRAPPPDATCQICGTRGTCERLVWRPFFDFRWRLSGTGEYVTKEIANAMRATELPVHWQWVHMGCYEGYCPYCLPEPAHIVAARNEFKQDMEAHNDGS